MSQMMRTARRMLVSGVVAAFAMTLLAPAANSQEAPWYWRFEVSEITCSPDLTQTLLVQTGEHQWNYPAGSSLTIDMSLEHDGELVYEYYGLDGSTLDGASSGSSELPWMGPTGTALWTLWVDSNLPFVWMYRWNLFVDGSLAYQATLTVAAAYNAQDECVLDWTWDNVPVGSVPPGPPLEPVDSPDEDVAPADDVVPADLVRATPRLTG